MITEAEIGEMIRATGKTWDQIQAETTVPYISIYKIIHGKNVGMASDETCYKLLKWLGDPRAEDFTAKKRKERFDTLMEMIKMEESKDNEKKGEYRKLIRLNRLAGNRKNFIPTMLSLNKLEKKFLEIVNS